MQELEKILEEIEQRIEKERKIITGHHHDEMANDIAETFAEAFIEAYEECQDIIRKHMNDGWIPVEKFGLPHSNEHDFRFWVTIQYTNGFRHTIKAKWDCFDNCFIHQNGKKILQDVIAYKYYSAPEPYRPERSDNHDGE